MEAKINIPDSIGAVATTLLDEHILFVSLQYDQDPTSPLEWGNEGEIISRIPRHNNSDPDRVAEELANNPNAVPLAYYEHGSCRWTVFDDLDRADGVWVPDADTVKEAMHLPSVVEQATDELLGTPTHRLKFLRERAESVCQVYSEWCNGEVYGYQVHLYRTRFDAQGDPFDRQGDYRRDEPVFEDACWGFYGEQYLRDEVRGVVEHALKEWKEEQQPTLELVS